MSAFRFSVGPWNVHSGADSYGPATRGEIGMEEKFRRFAEIGFSAVQFHDDDAVPEINNYSVEEIKRLAGERKKQLDKYGLAAEFVAPRLWMDPHCVDGGFTSRSEADREYAMWRAYRSIDIAHELGTDLIVLWLAREGTLCAESKDPVWETRMLIESINRMLDYDPNIRVCIEPKPNEPIDRSICGTMGHVMAVSAATKDPARVGGNLESAHATLAGLEPACEIGFALAMGKLFTVHLNDQNGLKFDQDKSFGVENLRSAFNQVKVLKEHHYGETRRVRRPRRQGHAHHPRRGQLQAPRELAQYLQGPRGQGRALGLRLRAAVRREARLRGAGDVRHEAPHGPVLR